jgi:thioredoxin 2
MSKKLFYIYANWCEACQIMTPTLNSLKNQIPVVQVNADYEDVSSKYNVRNIPTVILVENNQEIRRFTGARSAEQIVNWLNNG